jgi:hypothetical protein
MLKTLIVGFVGAVLGVLVIVGGYHLYVDHQNFHALLNWAASQAQAQQAAKAQ